MPFNIAGEWIPKSPLTQNSSKPLKPTKVRLVKRGNSVLTVILNLNMSKAELAEIASAMKKKLGCGGSVKEETIEIQGDKVEIVVKYLLSIGVKTS